MPRIAPVWVIPLVLVVGCAAQAPSAAVSPPGSASSSPSDTAPALAAVPSCAEVLPVQAAADRYADTPVYVGNEMPTEEVHAWASEQPGFEGIWIDREHNGWVTVAFSRDADERQAELEERFPDDGVVAVEVPWTTAELEALQQRVMNELGHLQVSTGQMPNYGVVTIGLGVLSPDRLAAVEDRFAGERICVEGIDPATLPEPGPQQLAGDGWRLVADERTGMPYRTGIAWDEASLEGLWAEATLSGAPPDIDFRANVVIWFGAVYSGSCPEIRLDDVGVDPDAALVHAEIVSLSPAMACTSDANPRAYVVTLERARLPAPPFTIQLGAANPTGEERTVVEADLRAPGSVARPGQVHADADAQPPSWVESGAVIETGFPWEYRMSVACGAEWLGELNSVTWRTQAATGREWLPRQWGPLVNEGSIVVSVLLQPGDPPTLTATANGHDVVYVPSPEDSPGCERATGG